MEEKIKIYEKCNTMTEKEIWDIVKDTDFKNPSTIKILDIGCGPGNAFFHFYVKFGTSNFKGFEIKSLSQIENTCSVFKDYGNPKLTAWLQEPIDTYSYFKKLIEYEILKPDPKINENEFNSLFIKKICFDTNIEESKILENTSIKFDLIILSKVLHYRDIKNPRCVIKKCKNLLTEDGLIFIKSRKTKKSNKKRKVDEEIFKKWTKKLKKYDGDEEIENDSEFLYFLGKK